MPIVLRTIEWCHISQPATTKSRDIEGGCQLHAFQYCSIHAMKIVLWNIDLCRISQPVTRKSKDIKRGCWLHAFRHCSIHAMPIILRKIDLCHISRHANWDNHANQVTPMPINKRELVMVWLVETASGAQLFDIDATTHLGRSNKSQREQKWEREWWRKEVKRYWYR